MLLYTLSQALKLLPRGTYLAGDNPVTVAITGNQDVTHTKSVTQDRYFIWQLQ